MLCYDGNVASFSANVRCDNRFLIEMRERGIPTLQRLVVPLCKPGCLQDGFILQSFALAGLKAFHVSLDRNFGCSRFQGFTRNRTSVGVRPLNWRWFAIQLKSSLDGRYQKPCWVFSAFLLPDLSKRSNASNWPFISSSSPSAISAFATCTDMPRSIRSFAVVPLTGSILESTSPVARSRFTTIRHEPRLILTKRRAAGSGRKSVPFSLFHGWHQLPLDLPCARMRESPMCSKANSERSNSQLSLW